MIIDLDDLLKESVLLASAKKAKAQGRKLHSNQSAAIVQMIRFEDKARWETKAIYIHERLTVCTCLHTSDTFMGYYAYQEARHGTARRLERVEEFEDTFLPSVFTTRNDVFNCMNCIEHDPLKNATIYDCDLLQELALKKSAPCLVPEAKKGQSNKVVEEVTTDDDADLLTELNSDVPFEESPEEEY